MHLIAFGLLLILSLIEGGQGATIVHAIGGSAVSHQSFVRLPQEHYLQPSAQFAHKDDTEKLRQTTFFDQTIEQDRKEEKLPLQPTFFAQKAEEREEGILAHPQILKVEPKVLHSTVLLPGYTPAHLTYAAHPVIHQMLPKIKPARNISFASLVPGPRSLRLKQQ